MLLENTSLSYSQFHSWSTERRSTYYKEYPARTNNCTRHTVVLRCCFNELSAKKSLDPSMLQRLMAVQTHVSVQTNAVKHIYRMLFSEDFLSTRNGTFTTPGYNWYLLTYLQRGKKALFCDSVAKGGRILHVNTPKTTFM